MKRKGLVIFLGVVVLLIAAGFTFVKVMEKNLNDLLTAEPAPLDLSTISDGVYEGTYAVLPVRVVLEVTVVDGVITAIEILEHFNGQGAAGEAVVDDVLTAQSLSVDAIAGATYSSKCILFAIENALMD